MAAAAAVLAVRDVVDLILAYQDGIPSDLLPLVAWNTHHPRLDVCAPSFDVVAAELRQLDRLLAPWYRKYGVHRLHTHLLQRFPHWANGWICQHAAWTGNLSVLCSLAPSVVESSTDVVDIAAAASHQHVLAQYSHLSVSSRAFDWAAGRGHLEVLQWLLVHHEAQLGDRAIVAACTKGHLKIVQTLAPLYSSPVHDALDAASMHGHFEIVTFLHHQRWPCTTHAIDMAAHNGHLNIVKFLHTHRVEGATTNAMDYAAKNGHFDVVKFLHLYRREGCTPNAIALASQRRHHQVVHFLVATRPQPKLNIASRSVQNQCLRWILSV